MTNHTYKKIVDIMTREEEILEYSKTFKGKGMENEELKEIIRLAIIDGAIWADEHPRKGLVDIDKVYKWLEENLHMYNTSECKGDRIAFVEDFKKAMEEQL